MYEVIGIAHRQYTNKQGKAVSGYNLYVTYEDRSTNGLACMREWISDPVMEDSGISIGDKVNLLYNRYGRVESIKIAG